MAIEAIELADIEAAARRIRPHAARTPLMLSPALSRLTCRDVYLKLETTQPTGSFKLRGAANAICALIEQGKRPRLACCSTGNHGRAVAYMAQRLGLEATIFVPRNLSLRKRAAMEEFGAALCVIGETQDDAQAEVDKLTASGAAIEIAPFDHRETICGQGTIGLEIMIERPDIETIIAPLSGGGLLSGVAIAAKALAERVRIVGATLEKGAAMAESLAKGERVQVLEEATVADALMGGIGANNTWTLRLCAQFIDEVTRVSDAQIKAAMRSLFEDHRLVCEGAGAIGLPILPTLAGEGPVAIVITGSNIDAEKFFEIMA
jgi:threonine dehydratase